MRKAGLKRFTNHVFLKRVGGELLDQFFERFPEIREQACNMLPGAGVGAPGNAAHRSNSGHGQSSALDYYSALAALFMRAERLPPSLIEDLLAIEEMSTPDGLASLQRMPEWSRLEAQLRPGSTAEDIAMQTWLVAPEILAREHNALRFRRLSSFEHAAAMPLPTLSVDSYQSPKSRPSHDLSAFNVSNSSNPPVSRARFAPPDKLTIANLTLSLDAWFARHQRGAESTQVEVYPMDGDLWFLIRHGDLFKRIAKVDRQRTDILHFRPRRDDVVVYSWRLNELRVNARSKAERDLYIREFGLHLHGDPNYFCERRPYTLEPLREIGREALDADGLEGIANIRLCKIAVRLENSNNEIITREADDLFYCAPALPFERGPISQHGELERALFEIQFTGSLRPRPVEIRVPNILKISQRCDPEAVENWLCRRGFRRGSYNLPHTEYIAEKGI